MYNAADIEIRCVDRDRIYDMYVGGRFHNFFRTFGEAVREAERIRALPEGAPLHDTPFNLKGGKLR